MSDKQLRVTFEPHGRTVFVLPGDKLVEAAAGAGLTIEAPCGGAGTCGKCRVQFTRGAGSPSAREQALLSPEELAAGWRLACQTTIQREAVVHVPRTSLFGDKHQILTASLDDRRREVKPSVRKVYVELPPPTLADAQADLLRLERSVGPFTADLDTLRQVAPRVAGQGYKGTAVLTDHCLIDFEPGDTAGRCYGVACDIGTTTLAASLVDLTTGEELAVASEMNPQTAYGDDVLSRIQYASASAAGLETLRSVIIAAVVALLENLRRDADVRAEHIYEAAFAGNTTMQHLLCGIDVSTLGRAPFAAPAGRGMLLAAGEMGLPIHPRARAYVLPIISGFVGGDTVAGILSSDLFDEQGPVLLVDIGTNGEIVLAHEGELYAASTAAGPAFEGARISCGMRAAAGAIEKVVIDDDVRCGVIADAPPAGLCGSGLIDLAAELLRLGLVSPEGRLLGPDELPAGLPEPVRRRVRLDESGSPCFVLAEGPSGPVAIRQRDIRELQLACGAIRAGIRILLSRVGLAAGDLRRVLIAGGFGSFIRRNHAQRIGLLPGEIEHTRILHVGNASLAGARRVLLSVPARRQAEHIARKARHVELAQDGDFQNLFAESMIFPES